MLGAIIFVLVTVALPHDQQKWLEAQVAAGNFASVEEAVAIAVADLRAMAEDDLAWAAPYVEEARRSVAAGQVISGEEFAQELEGKIASLRGR
jgi:antitoxin ParD1/3/4